eukprot:1055013-Amphidinium_carterae.1
MNWLVLGKPCRLPRDPGYGVQLSNQQRAMWFRIEGQCATWIRLGSGPRSGLGRSLRKFADLTSVVDRLSSALHVLGSTDQYLQSFRSDRCEGTTAKHEASGSDSKASEFTSGSLKSVASEGPKCIAEVSRAGRTVAQPIVADRLRFKHIPSFDAVRHFESLLLRAAYVRPEALWVPEEFWPSVGKVRVHASRRELLRIFETWDRVGCLSLIDARESDPRYRCGLFSVYKDEQRDRQIVNPIPENSRCFQVAEDTKGLAHGCMLGEIVLDPGEDLVLSASDLSDCYHTFVIPESHSRHNHISGIFPPDQLAHLRAYRPELAQCQFLVGCFKALPMGKGYAVEMTQQAHRRVLEKCGLMRGDDRVQYRAPIPRGPVYELLVIDDLGILSREPKQRPVADSRSVGLLQNAEVQYKQVKLHVSGDKMVRGEKAGTLLGAEIDGVRGEVRPPAIRVLCTAEITLHFLRLGVITRALLEELVGVWSSFLLHRRQYFSLLSAVYHEGENEPRDQLFRMSPACAEELLSLCVLAPLIYSDLRAQYLPKLFATDASPWGAALTEARITTKAAEEFARHAEQKGAYCRLSDSHASVHADLRRELGVNWCEDESEELDPSIVSTE